MFGPWGDYCGGSTYSLEYVSGPMLPYEGADPKLVDINKFYTDHNVNPNPYLEGAVNGDDWLSWEGYHMVRIVVQQGIAKLYRRIEGTPFQIRYKNPCRDHNVIDGTINSMRILVDVKAPVE